MEEFSKRLALLLAQGFYGVFQSYFDLVDHVVKGLWPGYRRSRFLSALIDSKALGKSSTLDARIRKIDEARENLVEAIEAIDDLRNQADDNKRDLAEALESLSHMEMEKEALGKRIEILSILADTDTLLFVR
jgi:hypothetical protein